MLREPMLHFALLGTLVFLGAAVGARQRRPEPREESRRIVIGRQELNAAVAEFERTWQRPPTDEERERLVAERVREEVWVREAVALGLDRGDPIVRRRLRQKMEFLVRSTAAPADPGDEVLGAWLAFHRDAFVVDGRVSFRQVFVSRDRHADAEGEAKALLERLRAGADPATVGDAFLLGDTFDDLPATEIAQRFGDAFAGSLAGVATGAWQGPVESAFGLHLVLVTGRREGRVPSLAEIRDDVLRDWQGARRRDADEQAYRDVLRRYDVVLP